MPSIRNASVGKLNLNQGIFRKRETFYISSSIVDFYSLHKSFEWVLFSHFLKPRMFKEYYRVIKQSNLNGFYYNFGIWDFQAAVTLSYLQSLAIHV